MKDIIPGTYWLVADEDGNRSICQGGKPKRLLGGWVCQSRGDSGPMKWISIDSNIHDKANKGERIVTKEDFEGLNFPKISFKESPVEIEIGKTGRVYTYESEHSKEDPKTS